MGVWRCDERTGTRKEIPPYTRRPLPSSTSNSRVSASYPGISTPAGEDLIFWAGGWTGEWGGIVGEHGNGAHSHPGYGTAAPGTHIRRLVLSTSRREERNYISSTPLATALGGLVAYLYGHILVLYNYYSTSAVVRVFFKSSLSRLCDWLGHPGFDLLAFVMSGRFDQRSQAIMGTTNRTPGYFLGHLPALWSGAFLRMCNLEASQP